MYTQCSSPAEGQTSCKVWLTSGKRRRCSNAAKMRNPLKFAGVPQTRQQISAVNRPKFAILSGHVEEVLLFNKFFPIVDTCLSCEELARQSCAMMPRWRFFCVIFAYFQRAACSTFQTCILMCGSMVDIQSPTAEIRRGKKKDRKKDRNHRAKI